VNLVLLDDGFPIDRHVMRLFKSLDCLRSKLLPARAGWKYTAGESNRWAGRTQVGGLCASFSLLSAKNPDGGEHRRLPRTDPTSLSASARSSTRVGSAGTSSPGTDGANRHSRSRTDDPGSRTVRARTVAHEEQARVSVPMPRNPNASSAVCPASGVVLNPSDINLEAATDDCATEQLLLPSAG
jgi:hypothetical protein